VGGWQKDVRWGLQNKGILHPEWFMARRLVNAEHRGHWPKEGEGKSGFIPRGLMSKGRRGHLAGGGKKKERLFICAFKKQNGSDAKY